MYEVNITIGATPSKYWASVDFVDKKGAVHRRQIGAGREASMQSNCLQALIDALGILNRPCILNIYSNSDYVTVPFQQGWVRNWEKHGWKNAKGREVRNADQWRRIRAALAPHSAKFIYLEDRRQQ